MKTKSTPPAPKKKLQKAKVSGKQAREEKAPRRNASVWCVANKMREDYETVFKTKIAAKQVVDIVLDTIGQILEKEGYICLRGIGTIRVSRAPGTEKGVTPPKNTLRRRLTMSTSWAMLDRLNPHNPKRKKKG